MWTITERILVAPCSWCVNLCCADDGARRVFTRPRPIAPRAASREIPRRVCDPIPKKSMRQAWKHPQGCASISGKLESRGNHPLTFLSEQIDVGAAPQRGHGYRANSGRWFADFIRLAVAARGRQRYSVIGRQRDEPCARSQSLWPCYSIQFSLTRRTPMRQIHRRSRSPVIGKE